MLEILKKIATISLDVQHISKTGNALYNGAQLTVDQLKAVYADLAKCSLNIEADIKVIQGLLPSEVPENTESAN